MGIKTTHTPRFTFPANARLKSKKKIDLLFATGKSLFIYPFSIKYIFVPEEEEANQFLVSVSKKKFKKAVDRNQIKRRVREAYRLNRQQWLSLPDKKGYFLIAYIYIAKEVHAYSFIEAKLIESLKRLHSKHIE